MARTSRKGGAVAVQAAPAERIWQTALYARLSVEDSGRKGADTIETQIELIHSYVSSRDCLDIYDTYIDNGESGADFERPAWNRMMDDIRSGKVNCIAVKDLSRFGRNYIETCEMLEKIFPFMGVRFISINDGYDSEISADGNEWLIVALKSLVNDQYLKDVSRKICSSVKARQERGEYTRGFAPFGYKKIDGQKGKLEPDPEAVPIVRDIYQWRVAGLSHLAICKRLDEQGIPTPNEYLRRKYGADMYTGDFFKSTIWRAATLKIILRNPVYIGTVQTGKESQRLYEHKPCTDVPREQWVITENAHEPIVDRELWDMVQTIEIDIRKAYAESGTRPERTENILKGYVICGICGSKMSRQYNKKVMVSGKVWETYYYLCPISRQHSADQPFRSIRADALTNAVFPLIAERLQSVTNLCTVIEKRTKQQADPRAALNAEIAHTSRELETITGRLAGLYESYIEKLLTESDYINIKAEYESRIESFRQRIDELSRRAALMADISASDNRWLKAAKEFQNPTELTRNMIEALVERIEVSGPNRIEVVWKFADEFELLRECASQGREVV